MNSSDVLISIVIPVYNTEKYLLECVQSAINQTLKNIEIIIVNDNSSGNCIEIVSEYQKKDSRIILINHEKNIGTLASRISGFNKASGKYILSLDSDDSLVLNACEIIYNKLESTKAQACLITANRYNDPDKNSYNFAGEMFLPKDREYTHSEWIAELGKTVNNCVCLYVFENSIIKEAIKKIDTSNNIVMYEDFYLVFTISTIEIKNIVSIPEKIYEYRVGKSGIMLRDITATLLCRNIKDSIYVSKRVLKLVKESEYYTDKDRQKVLNYTKELKEYFIKKFLESKIEIQEETISLLDKNGILKDFNNDLLYFFNFHRIFDKEKKRKRKLLERIYSVYKEPKYTTIYLLGFKVILKNKI